MSTHNDHHGHDNNNQVEGSGVQPKPILMFLLILGISTAAVYVIVQGLTYGFKKMDEMNQTGPVTEVSLPQGQAKLPPEPRLQGAPEPDPNNKETGRKPSLLPLDDMVEYNKKVNEKAASYEWVDKQGGVAKIPIARAKELLLAKGLPELPAERGEELSRAEATRKVVLNADANAGRTLKKPATAAPAATATPAAAATPAAQPAAAAAGAGAHGGEVKH